TSSCPLTSSCPPRLRFPQLLLLGALVACSGRHTLAARSGNTAAAALSRGAKSPHAPIVTAAITEGAC
ncbi:MAG TPA: hypothetical protein VGF76_15515, partial [Polyangiaceae bacterium]